MAISKKELLKRVLLAVPGFQALCRYLSRNHVRVLMYHRFAPDAGDAERLGTAHFARHLAYIAKHHRVLLPDEHLARVNAGEEIDGSPVVLTIDDGYADFCELAVPLLEEYELDAMLYVVPDFVSGKLWFWWDKLRYLLAHANAVDTSLHGRHYRHTLDSDAARKSAWSEIATDLSALPPDLIDAAITELAAAMTVELPAEAPSEYRAASWERLARIRDGRIRFGAHTCTHPALSKVPADRAAEEIDRSRRLIDERLGNCSAIFCYPHGQAEDYTAETVAIVERQGFAGAYVAFEPDPDVQAPYEMRRYGVHDDWTDFVWKLCGAQYVLQKYA